MSNISIERQLEKQFKILYEKYWTNTLKKEYENIEKKRYHRTIPIDIPNIEKVKEVIIKKNWIYSNIYILNKFL
jgi:hypothetical protein